MKNISLFLLSLFLLSFIFIGFADLCYADSSPAAPEAPAKYLKKHDLNKDGTVDAHDRLLWVKARQKRMFISYRDEEGYFLSEIDINDDGVITSDELRIWKEKQDKNGDGKISKDEL